MHIDFTLQADNITVDISMNRKQYIGEAIRNVTNGRSGYLPDYYFSSMQRRMVSAYKTLEEENIKNGDKLTAVRRDYDR